MRTDSFSQEKHLPVRRFIADESKVATGLYGPCAIAEDLDNLCTMFDPEADILGGTQKGGIGERNLQDGAVTYDKLHKDLQKNMDNSATKEELEQAKTKLSQTLETKAAKANTLYGYGITDAYSIAEMETKLLSKQNSTDASLTTEDKTIVGAINELKASHIGLVPQSQYGIDKITTQESIDKKLQETVLYETVVNTPGWFYQPTFSETLDEGFNTTDFYYVTLKDTDGTALPAGQFKLMNLYDQYTEAYDTVFTLSNLYTGLGTLTENQPVEFLEIGAESVRMRNAGVTMVTISLEKDLQTDVNCLATKVNGSFIKTANGSYFGIYYTTNKNVSNYHSAAPTTFNSDATKNIWHYGSFSNDSCREYQYCDRFCLEKSGANQFLTTRSLLARVLPYGATAYKHYSSQSVGFGSIFEEQTVLKNVAVLAVNERGLLKNGTVITVTEVK